MMEISNCLGKKTYEYDFFGNLKKVVLPDGKTIEYKLDGFNRRVAKLVNGSVVHYYLWQDQTHLAAILNPDGSTETQYYYGIHPQAPIYFTKGSQMYQVIANDRGDIRYVTDLNGEIVQDIQYDEYGMVLSDSSVTAANPEGLQPLGFASGLNDMDTRLVLYNARSYDPVVGRWTSKDPSLFRGGGNLYSYSLGDPVNLVDNNGRSPLLISGAIGAVIGGASGAAVAVYNGTSISQGAMVGAGTGLFIGSGAALFASGAAVAGTSLAGEIISGTIGGAMSGFSGSVVSQTVVTGKLNLRDAGGAAITGAAGGVCGPALGGGPVGDFASGIVLSPVDLIWGAQH